MRVIEKAVINNLILEGEKNLRDKTADNFGKYMYVPDAIDWMISELETLRRELKEREIEVSEGGIV